MRIIVQKFGGTSLAACEGRQAALAKIAAAHEAGCRPVVVVSAMGRRGDPYATDTLLELVADARDERELGLLASCGEIIAAVVMAHLLRSHGLEGVALSGGQAGIRTDEAFSDARIVRVDLARLRHHLKAGQVPVVAGFQGITTGGEVTTLGRGGSDTTATALGAAIGAEQVEIYTDVPGIMSADPQVVPDAVLRPVITYEEVAQMAREGAQVIHPRAVEIAMRYSLPVHVRSTFAATAGSMVTSRGERGDVSTDVGDAPPVTGITQIEDRYQLVVHTPSHDENGRQQPQPTIFRVLADAGISIDMINVSPDRTSFIVAGEQGDEAHRRLAELGFDVEGCPGCARISVVGMGMHGRPGVMAAVSEALHGRGVEILASVDSHLTISCLVPGKKMTQAVQSLHRRFGLAAGSGEAEMMPTPEAAGGADTPAQHPPPQQQAAPAAAEVPPKEAEAEPHERPMVPQRQDSVSQEIDGA